MRESAAELGGVLLVEVLPGVLGYMVTPAEPTVEEQVRYMRQWLVIQTVSACRFLPDSAPGCQATFFVRQGIEPRHGRALLHLFFQCR